VLVVILNAWVKRLVDFRIEQLSENVDSIDSLALRYGLPFPKVLRLDTMSSLCLMDAIKSY
jgi:hypothetical protein